MMKKFTLLFFIVLLGLILRFYHLENNPPSLSWDEASLGYNAFSIATSGKDEHGEIFPLARFIAFGDYKPPGYIYFDSLFVKFLGLSEWTVRLPSAIVGTLMIVIIYLLSNNLFKNTKLSLLVSFFMAFEPCALQFSRAAFESNLASFFNLFAIYFFLQSLKKSGFYYILSTILFIFSFYTFNANRIIAPMLLFFLSIVYIKTLWNKKIWIIFALLISLLMIFPSISFLRGRESKLRFQEVTIFTNLDLIKTANERIVRDGSSVLSKLIHNRRVMYFQDFLKHYSENFNGKFMFTQGDVNPRLSVQEMGELYILDLPFILIGLMLLIKYREKGLSLLLLWLFIVPVPAGTARETPHILRVLSLVPVLYIFTAYGLYHSVDFLKSNLLSIFYKVLIGILVLSYTTNVYSYLHNYYIHYPVNWSSEWQYGYKEMVNYVSKIEINYDEIYVTESLGRPYIYFAFYNQIPQEIFSKQRQADRDWFGFWNVYSLGKIKFGLDSLKNAKGNVLLVTTPNYVPSNYQILNKILNLNDEVVLIIADKK